MLQLLITLLTPAVFAGCFCAVFTVLDRFTEGTWWFSPIRRAKRRMDHWVNRRTLELELEGCERYGAKAQAAAEYVSRPPL